MLSWTHNIILCYNYWHKHHSCIVHHDSTIESGVSSVAINGVCYYLTTNPIVAVVCRLCCHWTKTKKNPTQIGEKIWFLQLSWAVQISLHSPCSVDNMIFHSHTHARTQTHKHAHTHTLWRFVSHLYQRALANLAPVLPWFTVIPFFQSFNLKTCFSHF